MPNWCWNTLHITGKKEELTKFMEGIKPRTDGYGNTYPCILATYIPYPDDIPEQTRECSDWMDENWGTKWGDCGTEIEWADPQEIEGKAMLMATFETAWVPPKNGIVKLSLLFPKLEFCLWYDEPDENFCGTLVIYNGDTEITEYLEGAAYAKEMEIDE